MRLSRSPILRCVQALAVASLVSLVGAPARGQDPTGLKENLDLPLNAVGEGEEEEEDAPEIVVFFGQVLEGDAFFYVIDRSRSMNEDGRLDKAKREVTRNVQEFSERVQFGIVFFNHAVVQFPTGGHAAVATAPMKSAAMSFVQSVIDRGATCGQAGLSAGLRMAKTASVARKVIVYLSDGGGTCPGIWDEAEYLQRTLEAVAAQNYERVQINTIGVRVAGELQEQFLIQLAGRNGGTYTRLP
ncbi:MAG: VWA domain-containing protein [Planctomycetes bacterium]|nr:VWA domain-containing protein [Planctomycetota bacterium]